MKNKIYKYIRTHIHIMYNINNWENYVQFLNPSI